MVQAGDVAAQMGWEQKGGPGAVGGARWVWAGRLLTDRGRDWTRGGTIYIRFVPKDTFTWAHALTPK